jgi:hypothetical protein
MAGNAYGGPMTAPRPQQELIGACAVHGRPPFNDATVTYYASHEAEPGATGTP